MARTKAQLTEDIKAAGGPDLNSDDYTVAQLEAELAKASGGAADPLLATLVDNGTKDAEGNTWRTEDAENGAVRVHLLTKGGIALNVVAKTEAEGRETLLASPFAK